jgi:predicted NUDIX family phosphoesterase
MQFGTREDVERDSSLVQPIPIVVFTTRTRDKILVFKKKLRSLSTSSPERRRLIIYAGGHVREEDSLMGSDEPLISIAKQAISREVNEELGVAYYPQEENPLCIWLRDHPTSTKHMAICFLWEVDIDRFTFTLNDNEFIQRVGTSKSGQFISLEEISSQAEALDSWTRVILESLFDLKVAFRQLPLELPFD